MQKLSLFRHRWIEPGEGVTDAVPRYGAKRFWFVLTAFVGKLFLANLLFLAFSIPIVTVSCAFSALTRVTMTLTRTGVCYVWEEFWKEFKTGIPTKILLGLLVNVIPISLYLYCRLYGNSDIGIGVMIVTAIFAFILQCYWYSAMAIVDLPPSTNLKNALMLMFLAWKSSLLMLITAGVIITALVLLLPWSLFVFPVLTFAVIQLIVSVAVLKPIEQYLIKNDNNEVQSNDY